MESADWYVNPSYFKFENMWLQHDGFIDKVKEWWQSYNVNGSPDYILAQKLKHLKRDISKWNKEEYGKVEVRASKALDELLILEQATEGRMKTLEVKYQILNLKLEIQRSARAEEASWRQKSKCFWFKEGDRNTKFLQRVASDNRRYNRIDKLLVEEEIIKDKELIKKEILSFSQSLYRGRKLET